MGSSVVDIFDTSGTSADYSGPMFLKFGNINGGSVGIDKIEISGSSVEHWESARVENQLTKTHAYNMNAWNKGDGALPDSSTSLPFGTLLSDGETSLDTTSNSVTSTTYDYDTDRDANPNQNKDSKYITQIIKQGRVANNLGGLDTTLTTYTCYYYSTNPDFPGKIIKGYQPSTQHGCTSAYTEYQYYSSSGSGYAKGDLQYILKKLAVGTIIATTEYEAYDDMGNPTLIKDPNQVETKYTYDLMGRVTQKIVDYGNGNYTTNYAYSGQDLVQVENPSNSTLKYSYSDTSGYSRLVQMDRYASPTSGSTIESMQYQYGSLTNASYTETDYLTGSGNTVTRKVYVENGITADPVLSSIKRKYQKTIDGDSVSGQSHVSTVTIYDDDGKPIYKIVDKGGGGEATTKYDYNSLSQLQMVTDAAGNTVSYAYDAHGNLASITAHNGESSQITTYAYDDFGRLISSSSPDAGTTYYKYDVRNNLIAKKDARNITTTYSYDSLNRLTHIKYPTSTDSDINYFYDCMAYFTMPNGTTVEPPDKTAYCQGRLTAVLVGDSTSEPYNRYTTYAYDSRGNIATVQQGFQLLF